MISNQSPENPTSIPANKLGDTTPHCSSALRHADSSNSPSTTEPGTEIVYPVVSPTDSEDCPRRLRRGIEMIETKCLDSRGPSVSSSPMSTSTHLPLCVYCGTARSADETRCPQCGRPWIDVRVGSPTAAQDQARIPAMVGGASAAASTTLSPDTAVDDHTPDDSPADSAPLAATTAAATTLDDTPTERSLDEGTADSTAIATEPAEDTSSDAALPAATVDDSVAATQDDATSTLADTTLAPSSPTTEAEADVVPPPPAAAEEETPGVDPSQRFVWLIPALIAGAAVIVVGLFGLGFLDNESEPTTAPVASAAPVPTTAAQTTTTQAPTTTAAPSTTTTSTTIPGLSSIESVGNAIPMSSLTLKAGGIGPLVIGDAAPDAVGRLVASLGRPEEIGAGDEELGLCEGEDGRFVRWAGLTVVVAGTLEDGVFAGYRFEEQAVPTMHLDLATPSGLRVGDPVSALNEIYAAYKIDYVSDGGIDLFALSDEQGLLLWGPVSSIEDSGRVQGIHSPDACSS